MIRKTSYEARPTRIGFPDDKEPGYPTNVLSLQAFDATRPRNPQSRQIMEPKRPCVAFTLDHDQIPMSPCLFDAFEAVGLYR